MIAEIIDLVNLTDAQVEKLSRTNLGRWLDAEFLRDVEQATVTELWEMANYSLQFIEEVSADDASEHPSNLLIAHTEAKHAQIVLAELHGRFNSQQTVI
jgi:hypothetical protein